MVPDKMKAAAIDKFGGPEVLHVSTLPVPKVGPLDVLIHVERACVGVWEPEVVGGKLNEGGKPRFPLVPGADGAGTVAAVGDKVRSVVVGDRVYGYGFQNPKGGFFAEYAALKEENVSKIPEGLSVGEAAGLAIDGLTALAGLDALALEGKQALLLVGASGGAGHIALQLALRRGHRVFAIASGADGVELAEKLGADAAADGKAGGVENRLAAFAPGGFDGALVFAGRPDGWFAVMNTVQPGGRVAYPNGVRPVPQVPSGVTLRAYDGVPSRKKFDELNSLITGEGATPFHVEVARTYALEEAAQALRDVGSHHIGKLALEVS